MGKSLDWTFLSSDEAVIILIAVALIFIWKYAFNESLLGFDEFPLHQWAPAIAALGLVLIAFWIFLPEMASMDFTGVLAISLLAAVAMQYFFSATLYTSIAAALLLVLLFLPTGSF